MALDLLKNVVDDIRDAHAKVKTDKFEMPGLSELFKGGLYVIFLPQIGNVVSGKLPVIGRVVARVVDRVMKGMAGMAAGALLELEERSPWRRGKHDGVLSDGAPTENGGGVELDGDGLSGSGNVDESVMIQRYSQWASGAIDLVKGRVDIFVRRAGIVAAMPLYLAFMASMLLSFFVLLVICYFTL